MRERFSADAPSDTTSLVDSRDCDVGSVERVDVAPVGGSRWRLYTLSQNRVLPALYPAVHLVTPFRVALSYRLSRRTDIVIQYPVRASRDKPTTCVH